MRFRYFILNKMTHGSIELKQNDHVPFCNKTKNKKTKYKLSYRRMWFILLFQSGCCMCVIIITHILYVLRD